MNRLYKWFAQNAILQIGDGMEQESRTQEPKNIVWQTRTHKQTEFERRLSAAMEAAFADGITELETLIDRLNDDGVHDETNNAWTADSFCTVMRRLGG